MNKYLPIKIGICDYLIDLHGNTWNDSGLPVSKMTTWKQDGKPVVFRLHIFEYMKAGDKDVRVFSEFAFCTGKKVTVDFMGKTYHPGNSDFELIKLHEALETETALAILDNN